MEIFHSEKIKTKNLESQTRRRMVIKLGSSTVCESTGVVRLGLLSSLAVQTRELKNKQGVDTIFVSSGASAVGKLIAPNITDRNLLSAIGQSWLTMEWNKAFYPTPVAQHLCTEDQLADKEYMRACIERSLQHGVIPVINCLNPDINNDYTGRLVAHAIDAELLAFLTTTNGVLRGKEQIASVHSLDEIAGIITDDKSDLGLGGMGPKCTEAWKFASQSEGIAVIAHGMEEDILYKLVEGQSVGTWFTVS